MKQTKSLSISREPIKSLNLHPHNARQGDVGAICQSLKAHGQYRPLVVQRSTGNVLAGNHTLQAAQALGWTEVDVTYIDVDDDQALRILLVDNRANDLATYDNSVLTDLLEALVRSDFGLEGTGFDGSDLDDLLAEFDPTGLAGGDEGFYTKAVNIPHYEIVGERPDVADLYDETRAEELRQRIAAADIPSDVRQFLEVATYRHTIINYRKVAEYYAHAPAEVQQLIEDSALVIIDYDDAIAKGYVVFSETIEALRQDNDDE